MNKKTSQNQTLQEESHQRNKQFLGSFSCKILRTLLKMDKRRTKKNELEDKKADDA